MCNIIHEITQYILLILTNRLEKAEKKQENITFCKKILTEQKRRDIV